MNLNGNKDIFGVMCILWTLSEFQNTFDDQKSKISLEI